VPLFFRHTLSILQRSCVPPPPCYVALVGGCYVKVEKILCSFAARAASCTTKIYIRVVLSYVFHGLLAKSGGIQIPHLSVRYVTVSQWPSFDYM
jgi:hypothetical protein